MGYHIAFGIVGYATYPVDAGVALGQLLKALWPVKNETVIQITGILWYMQYGFFAGLFYKLLRRKFSRKGSAAIVAAVILVSCVAMFLANHAYWENL